MQQLGNLRENGTGHRRALLGYCRRVEYQSRASCPQGQPRWRRPHRFHHSLDSCFLPH